MMQDLLRDMLTWMAWFVGISLAASVVAWLLFRRFDRRNEPKP